MIVAATGHRPPKLGGYSDSQSNLLNIFATEQLASMKITYVISGMALGWDLAIAQACVDLNIPFIAAIPYQGQELKWPSANQIIYQQLLMLAKEVVIVTEGGYANWKLHKRNRWMINESDSLIALWDGVREGGTFQTINLASKLNKPVVNTWDFWVEKVVHNQVLENLKE